MSEHHLYKVIVAPYTTEKTVTASENNRHFVFKVAKDANKLQIRKAVEALFDVKVASVKTSNVEGKVKRFKQRLGKRSNWKKACVVLKEGFDINLANFA